MMNPAFIFSFIVHSIFEIVAACALVYWVSEMWNRNPAPAFVRLVRHPSHMWIACGLAVIPPIFGTLLTALIFSGSNPGKMVHLMAPVYFLLSFFYGAIFGLAGSCCAGGDGARFRLPAACVAAVVLVLAPPWFMASRWLMLATHIFCLVVIVVVSCLILEAKKQPPVPVQPGVGTPPLPHKSSPMWALIVGFLPAIFVLLTITMGVSGISDHMSNEEAQSLLWLASLASVACCIVSSVMLFKRKTGAAVAGAIMLLLLNAFLSFFFGCCASLVGVSWH